MEAVGGRSKGKGIHGYIQRIADSPCSTAETTQCRKAIYTSIKKKKIRS